MAASGSWAKIVYLSNCDGGVARSKQQPVNGTLLALQKQEEAELALIIAFVLTSFEAMALPISPTQHTTIELYTQITGQTHTGRDLSPKLNLYVCSLSPSVTLSPCWQRSNEDLGSGSVFSSPAAHQSKLGQRKTTGPHVCVCNCRFSVLPSEGEGFWCVWL